jgi:hypothetical protein
MMNVIRRARCFLKSENAPSAVDYAVVLAAILMVCLYELVWYLGD